MLICWKSRKRTLRAGLQALVIQNLHLGTRLESGMSTATSIAFSRHKVAFSIGGNFKVSQTLLFLSCRIWQG